MKPAKLRVRFVRSSSNPAASPGDVRILDRALALCLIGDGRAIEVPAEDPPEPEPEPEPDELEEPVPDEWS